jgi:hypothetical protein
MPSSPSRFEQPRECAMRRVRRFPALLPATLALAVLVSATAGATRSPARNRSSVSAPATSAEAGCTTDSTLCLQNGRFFVEATWTKPDGSSGIGHPVNLSSDSGAFWFLEPNNVELVVKALNGCAANGRTWFFSGGLTNLGVDIAVTDTTTGEVKHYFNPQGSAFQPITDTAGFGCPAGSETLSTGSPEEPGAYEVESRSAADSLPGCMDGETTLCVRGRFRVEATWQTASGKSGSAHAVPLTSESGYFWFFDSGNVELLVKTLDACGIGKGNWFFAAGLTTVAVDLRVTDTLTGEVRTFSNPLGTPFLPIQDTSAFSFCPTPTPTPTPTSTPTATSTPTPTQAPRSTPPRPPTVWTVQLSRCGEFIGYPCFRPSTVHVRVGDTVAWSFSGGSGPHSTTSGIPGHPDGKWDSGLRLGSFTFSRRFLQAGTFRYFCSKGHCFHIVGCPPAEIQYEGGVVVVEP